MAIDKFTIPDEFKSELRAIEPLDPRSDKEIIATLNAFQPVTSEKNIWAYWHAGFDAMPGWCQRNVIAWLRICGPSWTIRVLDTVPNSPNHALEYVPTDLLPESFIKGTMTGPYIGPHSADFLRGACLYLHGGAWMDVGNILITSMDKLCWNHLADSSSPFNVAVPLMFRQFIVNHFTASRKGDPFIQRWHKLFTTLWQGQQSHEGISGNPLVASFIKHVGLEEATKDKSMDWDFCVSEETILNYISQVICWQRLCMLEPNPSFDGDEFNCSEYWQHHVLVFDVKEENWGAETVVGFKDNGRKIFDLLRVRLDSDKESQPYKDAYKLVWRLLTKSSFQKVMRAKGLTNDESLGKILDDPKNEGQDCKPGTFGELLRYGTVHFEQTRPEIDLLDAQPVKPENILKKGVLEP